MVRIGSLIILLAVLLSSCSPAAGVNQNAVLQPTAAEVRVNQAGNAADPMLTEEGASSNTQAEAAPTRMPDLPAATQEIPQEPTVVSTQTVVPIEADEPAADQPAAVDPEAFAGAVNPLTGLPVKDNENLSLPPALVSVTNFPVTARPQAGLSYSPYVFEMYIGEGMTRFLALFYGDYPQQASAAGGGEGVPAGETVGPVRSGRLPYDSLRKLYNGFLVMASASSNVLPSLGSYANVWGSDTSDINSAMIPVTRLEAIAENNPFGLKEGSLSGQRFEPAAPEGGKNGNMLWIPYNYLNQVIWRYDDASGAYHRYQDNADGKTFTQAADRLNGSPLTYENVVVLFATHHAKAETLIDIDLMYIDKMPALLFRDGKMYEIFWTTANAEFERTTGHVRPIRFIDAQGNPFPLKPGQTWVEIVQPNTPYNETIDSESYIDLKRKVEAGSGIWAVKFYPPVIEEE